MQAHIAPSLVSRGMHWKDQLVHAADFVLCTSAARCAIFQCVLVCVRRVRAWAMLKPKFGGIIDYLDPCWTFGPLGFSTWNLLQVAMNLSNENRKPHATGFSQCIARDAPLKSRGMRGGLLSVRQGLLCGACLCLRGVCERGFGFGPRLVEFSIIRALFGLSAC